MASLACRPPLADSPRGAGGGGCLRPDLNAAVPEHYRRLPKTTQSFRHTDCVVSASRLGRSARSTGSFRQVDWVVLPDRPGRFAKSTRSFCQVDLVVLPSRPGRSARSTGSFCQVDLVVLPSRPGRFAKSTWSFRQVDQVVLPSRPGRSARSTRSFCQVDRVVSPGRPGRFGKSTAWSGWRLRDGEGPPCAKVGRRSGVIAPEHIESDWGSFTYSGSGHGKPLYLINGRTEPGDAGLRLPCGNRQEAEKNRAVLPPGPTGMTSRA